MEEYVAIQIAQVLLLASEGLHFRLVCIVFVDRLQIHSRLEMFVAGPLRAALGFYSALDAQETHCCRGQSSAMVRLDEDVCMYCRSSFAGLREEVDLLAVTCHLQE